MAKGSFFSRLLGAQDDYPEEEVTHLTLSGKGDERHAHLSVDSDASAADDEIGELAIDIYQTQDAIVVKAFIAGVQPATVDISLTRESITVSGKREEEREVDEDSYYQRELYWGSFTRTVMLPEEVDVDLAEASERHGVLIVRLPKINKKKEMKLKVRSR